MANSDSSKIDKVKRFLDSRKISFVYEIGIAHSPSQEVTLFVSSDRVGNRAQEGATSKQQMSLLTKAIKEELSISVQWIITPGEQVDALESALRKLIEQRYPDSIGTLYISSPHISPVTVWVEPKGDPVNHPPQSDVQQIVSGFLGLFNIQNPNLVYEVSKFPTTLMILRRIKQCAPVTTKFLADELSRHESIIPNLKWLQSKLDQLRKSGILIRSLQGAYSLTESGTRLVPHNRNRSSSDVERALALGRRKW